MKILGIDPGNSFGYCLWNDRTEEVIENATKILKVNGNEIMDVYQKIKELIKKLEPEVIVIENSKFLSTRSFSGAKFTEAVKNSIIQKQAIGLTRSISFVTAAAHELNIPLLGISQQAISTLRFKKFPMLEKSLF